MCFHVLNEHYVRDTVRPPSWGKRLQDRDTCQDFQKVRKEQRHRVSSTLRTLGTRLLGFYPRPKESKFTTNCMVGGDFRLYA